MGFLSYVLIDEQRQALLQVFPARYPDVIAHHITIWFDCPLLFAPQKAKLVKIVGIADDSLGLQALVISVDDETIRETDGYPYHITWSLDSTKLAPLKLNLDTTSCVAEIYSPIHSNKLVANPACMHVLDQPVNLGFMKATLDL